jgi:hypothetical protein
MEDIKGDDILYPPGQTYPKGGEPILSEEIDSSIEVQISYLRRLHLKPWQFAKLVQALQAEAGLIPQEFPGFEEPVDSKSKTKRRGEEEEEDFTVLKEAKLDDSTI